MNLISPHIKRAGYRLAALTLFFLLTVLQSPAQHHGKRHGRSHGVLPDSVSTSDEEIKPLALDTVVVPASKDAVRPSTNVAADTSASVVSAPDSVTSTDTSTDVEESLVLRAVPDTTISRWKKSKDFAYANDPSYWQEEPEEEDGPFTKFFNSEGFRYTLYILLGAILLYALYRIIAENNLRFFYRRPTRLRGGAPGEADLPQEDLEQLLNQALQDKNHRMATRYLYLKTLQLLDARALIRWHSQATDEEYVRQMSAAPLGAGFRWLTAAYERVWYGKFDINDQQFSRLLQYFKDFHTSIAHGRS